MKTDENAQNVQYWIQEIEKRGHDSVASILVSKLGTPEAATIQMAFVEHHRKNDNSQSKAAFLKMAEARAIQETTKADSRMPLIIACVALCIATLSLILTVISNYL